MKRSSRFIKRGLALVLMLLLSIESFAAVVGDNDGAAFITKAEFNSMKNDFQSQLDRYNSSLDNKIDGAIASYLNGIRVAQIVKTKSILYTCNDALPVKFVKDWVCPFTQIGNRWWVASNWTENLWMAMVNNAADTKKFQAVLSIFEGNANSTNVTWVLNGNSDSWLIQPAYMDMYKKYNIDAGSYWKITPRVQLIGNHWHMGWNGNPIIKAQAANTKVFLDPADYVFTNANSSFQTITKAFPVDIYSPGRPNGDHDTYGDLNGSYTTSTVDELFDRKTSGWTGAIYVDLLSGGKVEGNCICVKNEDWNNTATTSFATYDCNSNTGWPYVAYVDPSSSKGEQTNVKIAYFDKLPKAEVYMKRTTTIEASDLLHSGWSNPANLAVSYFSGIPIFECQERGIVKLPLKFTFPSGAQFDFSIKKDAFSNSDTLDKGVELFTDAQLEIKYTHPTTTFSGTSYEITVYFRCDKDSVYWIKVQPKNNNEVAVNTIYETIEVTRE